jgi:hypothetical protein
MTRDIWSIMKPRATKCTFNQAMMDKCWQFAEAQMPTSEDHYIHKGQNTSWERKVIQSANGKLGEELAYAAYAPYFPGLSAPDHVIYQKRDKSWEPDLTHPESGIRIAVKTKDARDAKQWGASWVFEKTDRKIFGSKLDSQNLDPYQYVCMVVVDPIAGKGDIKACVKLQWLHDRNLFTLLDRAHSNKLTVRLENMERVIVSPQELWQLPIVR